MTLIELIVVMLLLGLVTGMGLIATAPQIRSARLNELVIKLQQADAAERRLARKSPRAGKMIVSFVDQQIRYQLSGRTIQMPRGFEIESIRHPQVSAAGSRVIELSRGRDTIVTGFNSLGQSITYSIRIRHVGSDTSRALAFIGLSGQAVFEPLSESIVAFGQRQ